MSGLSKALSRDARSYRIGVPWKGLSSVLEPLRGNLCVVLGLPGVGKSAFALNWAVCQPASCLLSLDTDLTTQAIRTAAIVSGRPMTVVKSSPRAWALYLERQVPHVRAYDLALMPREILALVNAEAEYWGSAPTVTVVDNVSNLIRDASYEEYRRIFMELHRVARLGNTLVLALHHVTRSASPGVPLTLTSGQFAGEQEAEMVLGLWARSPDYLNVSVLKNRNGEADPTGNLYATLRFERDTMIIRDMLHEEQAYLVLQGGA